MLFFCWSAFQLSAQGFYINEVLASNGNMVADPNGEYDDVVELVNLSTTDTIFLLGYYLSDDPGFPTKWPFPDTFIAPNSYLVVWCDDDILQPGLHTNFGLSAQGESVVLTNSLLTTTDRIDFPEQSTNVSYGLYPNGTGDWRYMYPTIGYGNLTVGLDELTTNNKLSIYPNPSKEIVYLPQIFKEVQLFDAQMRLVKDFTGMAINNINISDFESGIYWLKTQVSLQKIVKQ